MTTFSDLLKQTGLTREEISEFLDADPRLARSLYSGKTYPMPHQLGAVLQLIQDMEAVKAALRDVPFLPFASNYKKVVDMIEADDLESGYVRQ